MGGSGGKGYFGGTSAEEVARLTREAQDNLRDQQFENDLANLLRGQLADYNNRSKEAIRSLLEDMKGRIQDSIDGAVDLLFGGSIAKQTYLNGFSDVDCLVLLDTTFSATNPSTLRTKFAQALTRKYGDKVWVGALAVTVEAKGHTIQFLPAIRNSEGFQIGVPGSDQWSKIDPQRFAKKLTDSNSDLGGKLVPTIKLAKGVLSNLPDALRPSGYHIESLAIEIFRSYKGQASHQDLLRHFFSKLPDRVLQPIKDSTGQSVHVDDSLGQALSSQRHSLSRVLDRIHRRVKNADAEQSLSIWREIMGLDDQ